MEELDHTPDTSFERDVVCEDEEAFCLSSDNIAALQNLLQQVGRHCQAALLARAALGGPWQQLASQREERLRSSQHACVRAALGSFCKGALEDERVAARGAVEQTGCPDPDPDPVLSLR